MMSTSRKTRDAHCGHFLLPQTGFVAVLVSEMGLTVEYNVRNGDVYMFPVNSINRFV